MGFAYPSTAPAGTRRLAMLALPLNLLTIRRQHSCEPEHSRHFPAQVQQARNREGFGIGDGCLRTKVRSPCAMPTTACRRVYDHRMRDLTCEERDPGLFQHIGVPRSTAVSWIRRGPRPVVSVDVLNLDQTELQAEVLALQWKRPRGSVTWRSRRARRHSRPRPRFPSR